MKHTNNKDLFENDEYQSGDWIPFAVFAGIFLLFGMALAIVIVEWII